MATTENQNQAVTIGVMLTAFRRTQWLGEQLHAVLDQTVRPSDILIWDQSENGVGSEFARHAIRVPKNMGVWPRFTVSQYLNTDYIAVFDDDTIPGRRWLENCLRCFSQLGPCLLGGNGVSFADGDREKRAYVGWSQPCENIVEADIVGHSWVFPRSLLDGWEASEFAACTTYGEDYYIAYQAQRRGWKTYVPPHPPADKSWWSSVRGELGEDGNALYLQPGEPENKARFHKCLMDKGWKPSAVIKDDQGNYGMQMIALAEHAQRCPHCGGAL